jgi:cbb3-type cytochrome oxidase subunit 3
VLLFAIFIGICIWAWSKPQQKAFKEASMLPFAEEEHAPSTSRKIQ